MTPEQIADALATRGAGGAGDLAPCPFCGGEAAHATVRYSSQTVREQDWPQDEWHYVNCVVCGADNRGLVGHRTPDDAARAWNTRVAIPTPLPEPPAQEAGDG